MLLSEEVKRGCVDTNNQRPDDQDNLNTLRGLAVCVCARVPLLSPGVCSLNMCVWVSSPDGMFSGSGHCHSTQTELASL